MAEQKKRGWHRKNLPIPSDVSHLPSGQPVEFEPDIDALHQYYCDLYGRDPAGFVKDMFSWEQAYSFIAKRQGPYAWQEDVLREMSSDLQAQAEIDKDSSVFRLAIASGKGAGKSALLSQLFLWHIMCHRHSVTMLLGPTGDSVDQKVWREIGRWFAVCKMRQFFRWYQGGKVQHTLHPQWSGQYHLWASNRLEAIHGAHAQYLAFMTDETTAIPNEVLQTIESGLNDEHCTMLCISNPTRLASRFRQYFPDGDLAHNWHSRQIDVRDTERHNPRHVQELLDEAQGDEDDPWFRQNVRGLFPLVDMEQFITDAMIAIAQQRQAQVQRDIPVVIGVDVARHGKNKTVFLARQGAVILAKKSYSKREIDESADLLMEFMDSLKQYKPKAFIDIVGYGAGVYAICKRFDYAVYEVNSALPATGPHKERFENRRMELWDYTKDWLRTEGCIDPKDSLLAKQLVAPTVFVNLHGRLQLESKVQMEARGVVSPDEADALTYSFGDMTAYKRGGTWRPRDESY